MGVSASRVNGIARAMVVLAIPVLMAFSVGALFVHARVRFSGLGLLSGAIAAVLLSHVAFRTLRWRISSLLVLLPLLTVGLLAVVNEIAAGHIGTRVYPLVVAAEGVYLSVVPEPAYLRDAHRRDHAFRARFVRALHSCDERRVIQAVAEAVAGHGGELYGRGDLFSRVVLTRFIDEEWCSEALRRQVRDRAGAWLDQVRLSERQ